MRAAGDASITTPQRDLNARTRSPNGDGRERHEVADA
jgi:hypothetical protein